MNGRPHTVSPYRVALEQSHEALMAAVSRKPSDAESSVTISRNAKGVAQFEVVVRGRDVSDCRIMAQHEIELLEAAYPYPSTNGGEATP